MIALAMLTSGRGSRPAIAAWAIVGVSAVVLARVHREVRSARRRSTVLDGADLAFGLVKTAQGAAGAGPKTAAQFAGRVGGSER